MARQRGARIKVFVPFKGFKYGFATQKQGSNAHGKTLGHKPADDSPGLIYGVNSPKPPRASFTGADNTFSSFCDPKLVAKIKKTAGWNVKSQTRRRGLQTSGKTRTVYVDMPGGWKYAWNITSDDLDLRTDLGFVQAAAGDVDNLVWGADYPKPPRATRKNSSNQSESSFIKPQASVIDAAAAKGFNISNIDYDLLPNA